MHYVVFGLDCDAVFRVAASNRYTYCMMKLDGKYVITPTGTSTSSKPLFPSNELQQVRNEESMHGVEHGARCFVGR